MSGVEVNVRDGSDYWIHRDVAELERRPEEWNRVVATVAGAFKDAADDLPGRVVSPIFTGSDFERLEFEGQAMRRRVRKDMSQGADMISRDE